MNDLLNIARDGVATALGLLDAMKNVGVTPNVGTEAELNENIDAVREQLREVLRTIDDAEEDTAPNCGARNR